MMPMPNKLPKFLPNHWVSFLMWISQNRRFSYCCATINKKMPLPKSINTSKCWMISNRLLIVKPMNYGWQKNTIGLPRWWNSYIFCNSLKIKGLLQEKIHQHNNKKISACFPPNMLIFFYFSYKYFSEEKEEFSESSSRENNMPFTSLYKLNSIKSKGHILC